MIYKVVFYVLIILNINFINYNSYIENQKHYFHFLKSQISKKTIIVKYDTLQHKNIKVIKPFFSSKQFFSDKIEDDLKELLKFDYCNEESQVLIKYEIVHCTDSFISIIKTVEERFCAHYAADSYYFETINLLNYKGQILSVFINNKLKKNLYSSIKKRISETNCEQNQFESDLSFDIYFTYRKVYLLNPTAKRECFFESEIPFSKKYFEFNKIPLNSPTK